MRVLRDGPERTGTGLRLKDDRKVVKKKAEIRREVGSRGNGLRGEMKMTW